MHYYKKLGFKLGDFLEAEKYYQNAISIPLYYGLTLQDQEWIINSLSKFLD